MADHYAEAADGLEAAAKALRACGDDESGEDDQPTSLKDAASKAREVFAKTRQQKRDTASSDAEK